MNRAPRFTAMLRTLLGWVAFCLLLLCLSDVRAGDCPPPPYVPRDGDTCTATLASPSRDRVDVVRVLVIRPRQLDAADLVSWAVPGAVVVVKDGMLRGQTISLPLSLLSECRA